jgi:hypothetical protein
MQELTGPSPDYTIGTRRHSIDPERVFA